MPLQENSTCIGFDMGLICTTITIWILYSSFIVSYSLNVLVALLESMRPRQWAKNMFVFAGIVFDGQLMVMSALVDVLLAFGLLCLTASSIYLINDLVDIEKDKLHPKKKLRPIPSGRLPIRVARVASVLLPIIALGSSWLVSPWLTLVLGIYFFQHVAYSFYLKRIVILDIFAIAAGFVLRAIAGVVVISVSNFSPWLYACVALLSLFLAVGKRRQELILMGDNAGAVRGVFKDYNLPLLDDMLRMTVTITAVAYTLYVVEAETALVRPEFMLLTVPFVYYALFRYMYLIHVAGLGGDPTDVLYVDRPLQVSILLWGAFIVGLINFSGLAGIG
jgi:4-hydroxybenzoate polyprenyltransferase